MDKKWYLAELLEALHAANSDTELLHVNLILVRAVDAEEAYMKALKFGEELNTEYLNTEGVLVTVTFRGLRELTEIYEELADGSEIAYSRYEDISRAAIEQMAKPKEQLAVFRPRDWQDIQ